MLAIPDNACQAGCQASITFGVLTARRCVTCINACRSSTGNLGVSSGKPVLLCTGDVHHQDRAVPTFEVVRCGAMQSTPSIVPADDHDRPEEYEGRLETRNRKESIACAAESSLRPIPEVEVRRRASRVHEVSALCDTTCMWNRYASARMKEDSLNFH